MAEDNTSSAEIQVEDTEEPSVGAEVQDPDKVAAILAYVPFLCFYALFFRKDNAFAFHHGKQGLALFVVELAAVVLRWNVLWNVVLILIGAIAIWAMVLALRGEEFRIPVISDILDQYFN